MRCPFVQGLCLIAKETGQGVFTQRNLPESFANFFMTKIDTLLSTCSVSDDVYNGNKILDAGNEFFMTERNILKILKNLKIKNCEGFDRIPLQVFNEGAELLDKPLSSLFRLIYNEKKIPEQWKTARIIPLHIDSSTDYHI